MDKHVNVEDTDYNFKKNIIYFYYNMIATL